MAAYLKCCRLQLGLHVLRRSMRVLSVGDRATDQTKSVHVCARALRRRNSEDVKIRQEDKDKDRLSSDLKTKESAGVDVPHHIDQKLWNDLYEGDKHRDVSARHTGKSTDREYFQQAWHNKLDSMTQQDQYRRNAFHAESSGTNEYAKIVDVKDSDSFGALESLHDADGDGLSKKTMLHHRDPNERLAEEYPDDPREERDWRKNIPLTRYGRLGRKAYYYTKKMTKLGREGKVKEAIQVFDDWMMTHDRVLPSKRTFITLIGIVGRAGYTRKAFQLFRQMKHLGLDPPDHVYTSLFNACANCPMTDYGLKHASALYSQMQTKGIPPSPVTTMAAMKAFAMCGDFPRAFQILDERRVPLDTQCLNTLLMACAMDKETGLRTALKVWQMMRESSVSPSTNSYNLLIRCVRDCGVGNVNTLAEDFGLLGSKHDQEEIAPVDFFTVGERDTSLLLSSGQKMQEEKDFERNKVESSLQKDRVVSFEILPEISGADVTTLPPHVKTSEESLECFESWPVPDREKLSYENAMHEIMSPTYKDNASTVQIDVFDSESSCDTEWWEDSSLSQRSVVLDLDLKNNENPMISFPDKIHVSTNCNDSATKLALVVGEYESKNSSVVTNCGGVSVAELSTPPGRLALIGGMTSLVSHMVNAGVRPDVQTFSELLSCVRNETESEALVLRVMEAVAVAPDVDVLNDVIMRRNKRHQSHTVKEVLTLMSKLCLTPNMRTYAAVALTCHRQRDALTLLDNMKAANVEPTIEVMGHLIYISRWDFRYKRFLLHKVEELGLSPTPRIIAMIEKSVAITRRNINKAEKMADVSDSRYLTPKFQKGFQDFLQFYQAWLKRTELRQERHPWERFSDDPKKKKKKGDKL